ncbi:tyrosine-protein phosphatase [Desulfosarcina sp. OttesenSCG-928-B08]|nr:tyrosine-protein phosphatase [Desulfosarcina sp. OttesenSCG-928-B08]
MKPAVWLFCSVIATFTSTTSSLAAETRFLPLEGAFNVRDLGGYPAARGKTVKWQAVYRSGDLDQLTEADVAYLETLGIRTVVDFRSKEERQRAPHRLPETVGRTVEAEIDPGNILQFRELTHESSPALMTELNRVLINSAQDQYRILFRVLADPENVPVLFNCSAGKDRTGLAAALFLSALGVDRETIFQDYLLSVEPAERRYAVDIAEKPELRPLFTVRREYLEAAFDEIDTRYGGVEAYLTRQLGVDLKKMRRLYTE